MFHPKDVLTTGQVARICHVAPRTVSKWFDSGQLRGYRIPGSKDRRIPIEQLLRFMHAHGMPVDGLKLGPKRILMIDADTVFTDVLAKVLSGSGFEVVVAATAFEAGAFVQQCKPDILVVDVELADIHPSTITRFFRSSADLQATRLIAIANELSVARGEALLQQGFDGWLRKPFQIHELLGMVEQPESHEIVEHPIQAHDPANTN